MLNDSIKKICVVGGGQMGQQIALHAAINGFIVSLHDSVQGVLERAEVWADDYLLGRVAKGKLTRVQANELRANFAIAPELAVAVKEADLIIEAVVEDLHVKKTLFSQLDGLCPERTIFASNSSSFVPSQLADATKRPEKVINMHFFNPVLVMELVEVVQGPHTSKQTVSKVVEVSKQMGKTPIILKKEINGFIVNRILGRTYEEACRLLEADIARPEDIDLAITKALRWPMGPFTMMDMVGLDTCYLIRKQRFAESQSELDKPPEIMKQMYENGLLGRKSGKGFYEY